MAALIQLDDIAKTYPMPGEDVHALRKVSLEIGDAELVSIVGTSGSGKTTLLYLLGLLTGPSAGSYSFRGQEVRTLSDLERSHLRGREIGFVFQSFHLIPQLDVLGNVMLAARYARGTNGTPLQSSLEGHAKELIDRVGLSHRVRHRPNELSGGEMQRVAIARALLTGPSLILADEPTGNLDDATGNQIFDLLSSLRDEGKTIILVTHDSELAARTERCIRLKDGEVVDEAA